LTKPITSTLTVRTSQGAEASPTEMIFSSRLPAQEMQGTKVPRVQQELLALQEQRAIRAVLVQLVKLVKLVQLVKLVHLML